MCKTFFSTIWWGHAPSGPLDPPLSMHLHNLIPIIYTNTEIMLVERGQKRPPPHRPYPPRIILGITRLPVMIEIYWSPLELKCDVSWPCVEISLTGSRKLRNIRRRDTSSIQRATKGPLSPRVLARACVPPVLAHQPPRRRRTGIAERRPGGRRNRGINRGISSLV